MSRSREFHPIDRGTWTRGALRAVVVVLVALVLLTVVALVLDQDWWVTSGSAAAIVAVVGPLAILQWRHATQGLSLVVRQEALVLAGPRSREQVVRRDAAAYAAVFARVSYGPATAASVQAVLVTDGGETIWLTSEKWALGTLREIAACLDVTETPQVLSRAEARAAIGR